MKRINSADVVIVGSGIAGCLVAKKLALAGVDVLILEAGPRIERARIVENYRNSAYKGDYQSPYPPEEYALHPQYSPDNGYFIQHGPENYKAGYLRMAGGTTWHWSGQSWRMIPNDFRLHTRYGVGRDWPLSYDDLEPYYYEAEVEMGVGGPNEGLLSPRSKPYPYPEMPLSDFDKRFRSVVSQAGYHLVSEPVCRNSYAFDGRPACNGNNNCMPICPIGAQYTGEHALAKAEKAGVKVQVQSVAYKIEHDAHGDITAVHYKDPSGTSYRVTGKIFVLAANAIETPKLMLISKSDKFPNGIGNSSDMVGRNLMDHPGNTIMFLSKEPMWPGRGPMRLSCMVDLQDGAFRSNHSAIKINVGNYSPVRAVTEYLLQQGIYGKELDEKIRAYSSRWMVVNSFYDILPHPENRITASTDLKDKLGIPHPEVHYRIDEYIHRAKEVAKRHMQKIAGLFGGTNVRYDENYFCNNHIMGTLIMGNNPKNSVVDAHLRSHDHKNLFIASSGVMASAGTVNCTLTLAALMMRLGDTLLQETKSI